MKFAKCYKVPDEQKICESYQINGNKIKSNIETENIKKIIKDFIANIEFPIFFFIETPCTRQEEEKLNSPSSFRFHKNIYYLDYCSAELAEHIIANDLDILLNCGMCEFGFGSINRDEIYVCKYNVVNIFSENIQKYQQLLNKHNIPQTDKITTVWDTINNSNPADVFLTKINGLDYSDLMPKYFKNGMYFYKSVEC